MTKGHEDQVAEPLVHVDSSALFSPLPASPVDGAVGQARGLVIAGIRLNAGCTGATLNPRLLNDTRCNGSFKCVGERGARSDGYSLGKVSPAGWIVGALNTTVGALLLLTNKRKADAQTSIGADVYNHGGGLKIRRQF